FEADMKLVLSQDLTAQERSDAMRRDFVANGSHEIRTPLTVLVGFLDTMKNLALSDAERTRVLELMTQQAERMGHLANDLLTAAGPMAPGPCAPPASGRCRSPTAASASGASPCRA